MSTVSDNWPSLKKFKGPNYKESHDGREQRLLEYIYAHPTLPEMRGSPSKILEVIDEFAGNEDFLINIGEHKGKIVTEIIASEKPGIFVELGGYIGYSAILFADEMRKYASADVKLQYWSLEFSPLFASIAMNLIDLAGLSDIVKVVVGSADDSLKRLQAEGKLKSIDMLFLDHVEKLYDSDFRVAESLGLLKGGSTIIADNVVRPGAPEYRKFVRSHPGLESRGIKGLIMPGAFEDELEVTKVKVNT